MIESLGKIRVPVQSRIHKVLVRTCGYSIATRSYSKQIRVPEHKVEPMTFQLLARMCLLDGDSIGDTLKNPCSRKIFSPVSR